MKDDSNVNIESSLESLNIDDNASKRNVRSKYVPPFRREGKKREGEQGSEDRDNKFGPIHRSKDETSNYTSNSKYFQGRMSYGRHRDVRESWNGDIRRSENVPWNEVKRNPEFERRIFGESKVSEGDFSSYESVPVEVKGKDAPVPISDFQASSLHSLIKSNIEIASYKVVSPVQKHSIPIVCEKKDLMACAQTGSGKTAAFLLPILSNVLDENPGLLGESGHSGRRRGGSSYSSRKSIVEPKVLVLAPTRELVSQIHKEAVKFSYRSRIRTAAIYGGVNIGTQIKFLSDDDGCHIVIAAPGRLIDLISRGWISLRSIKYLVLDEADRILDMGFEPDIRKIVNDFDMPPKEERITLMFSATFPHDIQQLAKDFLREHVFLTVGRVGSTNENITQKIERVEGAQRRSLLLDILRISKENGDRTLIFVERKRDADLLEGFLHANKFFAASIHGDKGQREREAALIEFKNGSVGVLVATSVASRGLDIPNVNCVIIYDFPPDINEYVHKIGRTGRAGNKGTSIAFFTSDNPGLAKDLLEILRESKQNVPEWIEELARESYSRKGSSSYGRGGYNKAKDYGNRSSYYGSSYHGGDGGRYKGSHYGSQSGWNDYGSSYQKHSTWSDQ